MVKKVQDETKGKHICGIYVIECLINGKIYIGQSQNIYYRWKKHKEVLRRNKHFNRELQEDWNRFTEDDFKFSLLEECSVEELDDREIYWIAELHATIDGYNIAKGGKEHGNANCVLTNEQVLEIIKRFQAGECNVFISRDLNISANAISGIRNRKVWCHLTNGIEWDFPNATNTQYRPKRKIDLYLKDGSFVKTFDSINDASKETGITISSIYLACTGVNHTSRKKYVWRFHNEPFDKYPIKRPDYVSVDQYDKDWNYIATYETMKDAANSTGVKYASIAGVIHGQWYTSGGYHWLRHGEKPSVNVIKKRKRWVSVNQYDSNWNYIATFETIKQASDATGINASGISGVIKGRYKTAGGFYWLRYEENNIINQIKDNENNL